MTSPLGLHSFNLGPYELVCLQSSHDDVHTILNTEVTRRYFSWKGPGVK